MGELTAEIPLYLCNKEHDGTLPGAPPSEKQ